MSAQQSRDRFIPFRKTDVIQMCLDEGTLPNDERTSFREFCAILESLIHVEYHRRLELLKECYAPFDPGADTRTVHTPTPEEKRTRDETLVETLSQILDKANFEKITEEDLDAALKEESLFKIRLRVNFDDFEQVIFYRRGESIKEETLVKYFGLKKKRFVFTNYDRVAVYIKFKDAEYFQSSKRDLNFIPGATIIKLFQNVPKADLEMLFPNSEVRMKTIDKLIIGVPAAVSGVTVVATKLSASLLLIGSLISFWLGFSEKEVTINQTHLIVIAVGLGTLGAFLFKQFMKFKNRKILFMKALSDNLYFKNLDNNAGVFHHLIDSAEEEEFKEAVLAYYFLLTSPQGLSRAELDGKIETWLEQSYNCHIDFEISDALDKLTRWELVHPSGESFVCRGLTHAKQQIDRMWDGVFRYEA